MKNIITSECGRSLRRQTCKNCANQGKLGSFRGMPLICPNCNGHKFFYVMADIAEEFRVKES